MSKVDFNPDGKKKQEVEQYRLKREKEKRTAQYKSVQSHDFFIDKSRSIAVSTGAEDIKKENKVLDLGSGVGLISNTFGMLGCEVTGYEIDSKSIELAEQMSLKLGL